MVLCFGELLLRIGLDSKGDCLRNNSVALFVGGAEANVATNLSRWRTSASYLTVLPDNILGKQLMENMRAKGVDVSKILLQGDKVGLYYLNSGQDVKNTKVIYDRAFSSFSQLRPSVIDWKDIFKDVSWFHFSAISPALNEPLAEVCLEALKMAHEMGIYISVDLNYRAALWADKRNPKDVMLPLLNYCDMIMGNLWSIHKMTGIPSVGPGSGYCSTQQYVQIAFETGIELFKAFPKCKAVAKTFRFDKNNTDVSYFSTLCSRVEDILVSTRYTSVSVPEKVGSGDCFMAGLIYGNYKKLPAKATLEFATAAAFNKLFISGDSTTQSEQDITNFICSNAN